MKEDKYINVVHINVKWIIGKRHKITEKKLRGKDYPKLYETQKSLRKNIRFTKLKEYGLDEYKIYE